MSDCDQEEGERRPRVRAKTESMKRLSKRKLALDGLVADAELEGLEFTRPKTRGDCLQGENAERPCPFVSCKHHLYVDVNERSGAIKLNFPHLQVWELPESCALDVADRDGITLEEVGTVLNKTRERIRQIESAGLAKLKVLDAVCALSEEYDPGLSRPDLHATNEYPFPAKRAVIASHDRIVGRVDPRVQHREAMHAARLNNSKSPKETALAIKQSCLPFTESLEDWVKRRAEAMRR